MATIEGTQRERLMNLFSRRTIIRASELKDAGITPTTIAKAVEDGELERLSRGLYQRCNVDLDHHHALAIAAMRVPGGVVAMLSALAFHGLIDEDHPRVWMAIGPGDRAPGPSCPPLRIVRFAEPDLRHGIEHHTIGGISVPIYAIAKTLADVFRHPRLVERSIATDALRRAMDERRIGIGAIEAGAKAGGVWTVMQPWIDSFRMSQWSAAIPLAR